jgi:DNA polymerase-1
MTKTLLLVDGENLLHRSFHKFENFKSSDGTKTGAMYGFMKTLHSNIFRFSVDSVVVVFDNGRSKHRLGILPDYKGSRKQRLGMDYDSLQFQKREIRKILKYLNIPVVFDKKRLNNWEGDDYIALIAENFTYNKGKVMILSSDKDFNQLIDKNTKVVNPSKGEVITEANCKSLFGYSPAECVNYLSMVGDTSDNIPGITGMGPKRARVFLDSYGSLENYIKLDKQSNNPLITKDIVKRLRALIDLKYFMGAHPIKMSDIPIKYGKSIDISKLTKIVNKYSMISLRSSEFINVFKKLKVWRIG